MEKTKKNTIEVSVIVPCYNEENTIQLLLGAIHSQNYPVDSLEVIIADAYSEDRTREKIKEFTDLHPDIRVRIVDNKKRTIPAAINEAAAQSTGTYLIRLDAHSVPDSDYIAHSIEILSSGRAENVGGIWLIRPGTDSCIARAIARAASHPVGAGDAGYRVSRKAAYVDTVPFGAFRKETFEKVGKFDETMLANEDYEFNTRLRKAGGRIWLDPRIQSTYYARGNLRALGKQYWRYGFWKYRMLRRYPESLRWRQALPPIFVLGVMIFAAASFFFLFTRIILGIGLSLYALVLIIIGAIEAVREKDICMLNIALALIVMHFSWGSGFILSVLKGIRNN